MKPWEKFSESKGEKPWEKFGGGEAKRESKLISYEDALRETLQDESWIGRNVGSAGAAVANAWEGIKGLAGKANEENLKTQAIFAEEAPVGNIAGNIAMLAPTALIPGVNTLAGSAAVGGITNALITPGDFKDRAVSGAMGAGGGALGYGLSKAIKTTKPAGISKHVKTLTDEGIELTPGQTAGGWLKSMEDKLQSMPLIGDVITSARKRGISDFNKAAIKRASIEGKPQAGIGNETIGNLRQSLSDEFTDVLKQSKAQLYEKDFVKNIAKLEDNIMSLPAKEQQAFANIINRELGGRIDDTGVLKGDKLQAAYSGLTNNINRFKKSTDGFQNELADILDTVKYELIDSVERQNSGIVSKRLKDVNKKYANFKRVQRAAGMTGAKEGVFTPAQLKSAVRALDTAKDKRAFSEGTALLQDLTTAAESVLPNLYPDSGTAGRMMAGDLIGMLKGGALAIPGYVAYSRPGQKVLNAFIKQSTPKFNKLMKIIGNNPDALRVIGQGVAKPQQKTNALSRR